MPELPEVETMRRGILPIVGRVISKAQAIRCTKKPLAIEPNRSTVARRLRGRRIEAVDRVGKRLAIWLDSQDALTIELRMTGLVLLTTPPTQAHLRYRIAFESPDTEDLLYWDRRGLGKILLYSRRQFYDKFNERTLGPDALSISSDDYAGRLGTNRRAIKVALLDQRAVAGIGNLYASEILHLAKINPQQCCAQLGAAEWTALADATLQILEEAIRYEGSTLGDGTYRNALNQDGSYQNKHRVYAKDGTICPTCRRDEIRRIVQAGRSTFYCHRCQK